MASTTKTTTKSTRSTKSDLLYDSRHSEGGKPAYTEVTILIESRPQKQYVGGRYSKAATGPKYWGETFNQYLSDFVYDSAGLRFRIKAKALTEGTFEEVYKA